MQKNKKIGCLSLLVLSPLTMAMQPLDDHSLSSTVGQDGLDISMQANIGFQQIAVVDTDGLSYGQTLASGNPNRYDAPDYKEKAGLVIAGVAGQTKPVSAPAIMISGLDNSNTPNTLTVNASIDTDAGSGVNGAFTNIAVTFANAGIRISPFSIYAAPKSSLSSLVGANYTRNSIFTTDTFFKPAANVREILRVKDNIDILFNANKPKLNIQLGSAPQGKMVMFSGAIDSICGSGNGCNMMLVSDYLTSGDVSTSPVGVGFDFQFAGHTNIVRDTNGTIISQTFTPFSLNGFYAGIEGKSDLDNGGFVFGNAGESSKFDLKLNNVTLGNTGSSAIGTFNSLPNASIGNIGAIGASVTNLKVKVSGM